METIILDNHVWVNWILDGDAVLTPVVIGGAMAKSREVHYANTR
jgi:hypothetical protein